jgi:hypothetical protein
MRDNANLPDNSKDNSQEGKELHDEYQSLQKEYDDYYAIIQGLDDTFKTVLDLDVTTDYKSLSKDEEKKEGDEEKKEGEEEGIVKPNEEQVDDDESNSICKDPSYRTKKKNMLKNFREKMFDKHNEVDKMIKCHGKLFKECGEGDEMETNY